MMTLKNYLVSQPVYNYFKKNANSDHVLAQKTKRFSDVGIKPLDTSNNSLAPVVNHLNTELRVKFDGSCLKKGKVTFYIKMQLMFIVSMR